MTIGNFKINPKHTSIPKKPEKLKADKKMNLRNKKKEQDKVTQALFVIDESGSMQSCRNETISGINEQIQELKKHTNIETFVTIVTFNSIVLDKIVNIPITEVTELTDENYIPNGSTALYDAIAHTILRESNRKYNTKDVTRILVIVTDGQENASQEYSRYADGSKKIAKMIKKVQKEGWTITYLGANQDLTQVHTTLGINMSNIASYTSSTVGTKSAFTTVANGLTGYMKKRELKETKLDDKFFNEDEIITNV